MARWVTVARCTFFGGQYSYYKKPPDDWVLDWLSRCAPVLVYTPESNTWSTKASMPTPRSGVAVAELNGEIWVIGGVEDPDPGPPSLSTVISNKVEIYNPEKNSWRTVLRCRQGAIIMLPQR